LITMSDAHSLLAACWTTGDTTPLLVLADLLDERADHDTAELIRLTAADARTARHSPDRGRRLKQLRDGAWQRVRATAWPDMAVQPDTGTAGFSRRPDASSPARESIAVRPERGTIHRLRVDLEGGDEVVRSHAGEELLRRELPPHAAAFLGRGGDIWASLVFAVEHDYFPLPDGWRADPEPALAARQRRMEATLSPALIAVTELPAELVPFVGWVLAEYLAGRSRRARGGEAVPGAHLFVFRGGRWHHAASLDPRDSGRAAELLRRRVRWERARGGLAGLLVRVADDGRLTARKLVWFADGAERETVNLGGVTATLGAEEFRQAAGEIGADEPTFVLDGPEKLRGLFTSAT
jgi:uncharacterized protein (TIGR02996 family)